MKILLMLTLLTTSVQAISGEWKQLAPLPDKEGFAGPFAGVSHDVLIVAGGANFPDKRLWDGGTKVWYDTVFALEKPGQKWKVVGKLPRPLGYGVSVTFNNSVVCIGGCDAERHFADVFRLEWKEGRLVTTTLSSLPKSTANACGALIGDMLYVAGGRETPDATTTLRSAWRMNLAADRPAWEEIEPCPAGGRMLAVAAGFDDAFWMIGGVDLIATEDADVERRYLSDAYRYDPGEGWRRIADLPHPVVAAPTPAPCDAVGFYLLGGDDGSQFGVAPQKHSGFSRQVLQYSAATAKWVKAGELPAPRVTVPLVSWNDCWVVPSGEARPSVRSPDVWAFRLDAQERSTP